MITADVADAIFGVKERRSKEQENKPKLGVVIETTEKGVLVNKVMDESIALQAGIKEGDYIVEMAGVAQDNVMGVIETVQKTPVGRWLPLIVQRGDERVELVAKFPAESPKLEFK
jgi:S1-C subfamily serine protease